MKDINKNQRYVNIVASISFYDLSQDEFKNVFDVDQYLTEVRGLSERTKWDVQSLSQLLKKDPKVYTAMTFIFRDIKFSNSQSISFMFDVNILNSNNKEKIIDYLIFNLENDPYFKQLFMKTLFVKNLDVSKIRDFIKNEQNYNTYLAAFKETVKSYIEKQNFIEKRLSNDKFADVRERISVYFINKLGFSNILESVKLENYLRLRKRPRDVRTTHGDFGQEQVKNILLKGNFLNIDSELKKNNITTLEDFIERAHQIKSLDELKNFCFATQLKSKKILTNKKKPKKFDFVLMYNLKPKILIETNFYEGGGTKIGINIEEYMDLKKVVNQMEFRFIWITDGPFWTETSGKAELFTLFDEYDEDELFTYNLFELNLEKIKSILRS